MNRQINVTKTGKPLNFKIHLKYCEVCKQPCKVPFKFGKRCYEHMSNNTKSKYHQRMKLLEDLHGNN